MAAGVIPGSLVARAMLSGLASSSFCFTSLERPVIFKKEMFLGIGVFSFFCSFFISWFCLFIYPSYFASASILSMVFCFVMGFLIGRLVYFICGLFSCS